MLLPCRNLALLKVKLASCFEGKNTLGNLPWFSAEKHRKSTHFVPNTGFLKNNAQITILKFSLHFTNEIIKTITYYGQVLLKNIGRFWLFKIDSLVFRLLGWFWLIVLHLLFCTNKTVLLSVNQLSTCISVCKTCFI